MKVLNVQKKDDGDKVYWKIMPPACKNNARNARCLPQLITQGLT